MKYWIVWKTDDAIYGRAIGLQTQVVLDGPFDDMDIAFSEVYRYPRAGHGWSTVVESDTKPEEYENEYEFTDAAQEFYE